MKACIVDRYGKTNRRLGEMPEARAAGRRCTVEVQAAGVNPLDSKIRDGEVKLLLPNRLPPIQGNEGAGVGLRVGSRVQRFKSGDEVCPRPAKDRIGTFAERIAITEAGVAKVPRGDDVVPLNAGCLASPISDSPASSAPRQAQQAPFASGLPSPRYRSR